jgi:hypothetical protein
MQIDAGGGAPRAPGSPHPKAQFSAGRVAVFTCAVLLAFAAGRLNSCSSATVETDENLILGSRTSVDVDKAEAVFDHVFQSLPLRNVVYPSGDHYYFSFYCSRGLVRGNLRLTPELRKNGTIGLTYSPGVPGRDQTISVRLGRSQGVHLMNLGRHACLCSYGAKVVVFLLNGSVTDPGIDKQLLPGESAAVSVFDESGLQFNLVFQNAPAHLFWILNRELPVAEDFDQATADIMIGRRTRFAFFVDQPIHRWTLVGVDRRNSKENTWFDGPFDQLPAEEMEPGRLRLREYLEYVYPSVRGQIDEHGRYKLLPDRDVPVMPWVLYDSIEDLAFIESCKQRLTGAAFYSCITPDSFAPGAERP